jgi:hypothetical protein
MVTDREIIYQIFIAILQKQPFKYATLQLRFFESKSFLIKRSLHLL